MPGKKPGLPAASRFTHDAESTAKDAKYANNTFHHRGHSENVTPASPRLHTSNLTLLGPRPPSSEHLSLWANSMIERPPWEPIVANNVARTMRLWAAGSYDSNCLRLPALFLPDSYLHMPTVSSNSRGFNFAFTFGSG
jgi:hypothetical protein